MKAKSCSIIGERKLEAYLTELMPEQIAGSIYDASVVQVEDHLLTCPACQEYAETHELLMSAVRSMRAETRHFCLTGGMTHA